MKHPAHAPAVLAALSPSNRAHARAGAQAGGRLDAGIQPRS